MNVSFNHKRMKTYARFRHRGQKEVHLGNSFDNAARMLKCVFRTRHYIETGLANQSDLDALIERLRANMSR